MAMNPMQRKTRNSFLLGFLIAIIIGAIIIGLLFMKIKKINETLDAERQIKQIAMTDVYTVTDDVKANEDIKVLSTVSMKTDSLPDNAITDKNINDYMETNSDGDVLYDENGNSIIRMVANIAITPNTPLTTDMVKKTAEAGSFRLVEYPMIQLPSKLAEGDYIDIRLKLPTEQDFIVLTKMKVEEATASTIWLKVSESQYLTLNNAILESYVIDGAVLYATQYINAAQAELNTTYSPSDTVMQLIRSNSVTDADRDILNKQDDLRARQVINELMDYYADQQIDKVQDGFETERNLIEAAREEVLGDIGY